MSSGVNVTLIERHFGECVKAMFRPAVALHQKQQCLINFSETTALVPQLCQRAAAKKQAENLAEL